MPAVPVFIDDPPPVASPVLIVEVPVPDADERFGTECECDGISPITSVCVSAPSVSPRDLDVSDAPAPEIASARPSIFVSAIVLFAAKSAAALAPPFTAVFIAQSGKALDAAMREEFVKLARAKGLSETIVILRHAARAALNPLITLTGISIGALVSGSVIVETVLGRQGIGSLTVAAVRSRDVPLVMGIVLAVSIAVWLANAVGELLQIANDRRLLEKELD